MTILIQGLHHIKTALKLREPRYSVGKENSSFFRSPEEEEFSLGLAYVELWLCARVVLLMPAEVRGELCTITNVIEMFKILE